MVLRLERFTFVSSFSFSSTRLSSGSAFKGQNRSHRERDDTAVVKRDCHREMSSGGVEQVERGTRRDRE